MRLPTVVLAATCAGLVLSPAAAQFAALQTDPLVALGEPFCVTYEAPTGWAIFLFSSSSPGPTATPLGEIMLGPDVTLMDARFAPSSNAFTVCLGSVPCDPAHLGLECFFQFVAFNPANYSSFVLSNGASDVVTMPLGPAADFNVYTLGDLFLQNAEVDGRVAASGNAGIFTTGIGSALPNSNGTRDDLIAGGNLQLFRVEVYNGNVVYGGTATIQNVGVPHGTISQGTPLDFATANAFLLERAAAVGAMPPNGSTFSSFGTLTLTGSNANQNVFAVNGTALAGASALVINAPAGSTTIVNVSGLSSALTNIAITLNGPTRNSVLFNFHQATTLTLSGVAVEGSILAPLASVSFNDAHANGQLVVGSLSGNGEAHHFPFTGCPH